jgi:DNA-binding CsgD family transcriptional regulator
MLLPAIDEVLECGLLTGDNEMLMFSHELVRSLVESSMPRSVLAALRDESARLHRRPAAHRPPARRAVDWSLLTPREQEIAELVGRAMTNRQIATRVGRSPHTVNYHLRQIFQKLDLTSRVELASLTRQRETAELPAGGPSSS